MTIEYGDIVHNRVIIDPLNLTDEGSQLLYKYLQRWRHNGLHIKRDSVLLSGLFSHFTLTHDIYVTEVLRGKWRYDVLANESIGVGGTGTVYQTQAVIRDNKLQNSPPLIVTRKQKRVCKSQPRDAWHEYSILKRCHYLHARPLLAGIPSILSMRELPGKLLIDVLNDERKHQPFSLRERYALTAKALRALKKLHDLQICHNDLTPRNIMYDRVGAKVSIFDFGISKLVNDKSDLRSRGNAVYAAPEEFISERTSQPVSVLGCDECDSLKSHTTQASDIFSLGRILSLVWRADDPLFADQSGISSIIKKRAEANWRVELDLFHGMRGLNKAEKNSILNWLTDMLRENPEERPAIEACVSTFADIYLSYKLRHVPEESHGMVISAHYFAKTLLHELDRIEKISDLRNQLHAMALQLRYDVNLPMKKFMAMLAKKFNKECNFLSVELEKLCGEMSYDSSDTVQNFSQAIAAKSDVAFMSLQFMKYTKQLADNHYAVAEFIECIDVFSFNGLESKADLLARFQGIVELFHQQSQALSVCLQSENQSLQLEARHLKNKIESTPITIDFLNEHAHHIEQKLIKLERDYQGDFRHLILHPQLGI